MCHKFVEKYLLQSLYNTHTHNILYIYFMCMYNIYILYISYHNRPLLLFAADKKKGIP